MEPLGKPSSGATPAILLRTRKKSDPQNITMLDMGTGYTVGVSQSELKTQIDEFKVKPFFFDNNKWGFHTWTISLTRKPIFGHNEMEW